METTGTRRLASGLLTLIAAVTVLAGSAHAAPKPAELYRALLKAPKASSLPSYLHGATTRSATLSQGSRSHHAVGAVSITNAAALVGFLVFPTHALAVADLKAFPPNGGPNKIVSTKPAGLPLPAYVVSAARNGYVVAYVVFVQGNVLVNSWAYGQKGTTKQLIGIVTHDAHWASSHLTSVMGGR